MSSTEDVQDLLDKLLLEVFEMTRAHTTLSNEVNVNDVASEKSNAIHDVYIRLQETIRNLRGIKKSKAEQSQIISNLNNEYQQLRNEILSYESNLRDKRTKINDDISKMLDTISPDS